ncbi:MAG TPA: kinase/pyrophosphorylase [Thermopetrobacter sp.]|nr:kinase/pyrophosphorylase [Thermopetrobacter sp.]
MHLISDSSGETLLHILSSLKKAYRDMSCIEHLHTMVHTTTQLDLAMLQIEQNPGIVLHTLGDARLRKRLEAACRDIGLPCVGVLDEAFGALAAYLNQPPAARITPGASLDDAYFTRMQALDFAMLHDDGQNPGSLHKADVILIGVSRTSKTPTSIYLANRGLKTANIPYITGHPLPPEVFALHRPMIVGLIASPLLVAEHRRKRLDMDKTHMADVYTSKRHISAEINELKELCARRGWPLIDVTRRSIEETAAIIINLINEREDSRRR